MPHNDAQLAEIFDLLTAQAARGEPIDWQHVREHHADLESELRQLFGAVMVTDAVAQQVRDASAGSGADLDNSATLPVSSLGGSVPIRAAHIDDIAVDQAQWGDYQLQRELGRGGMGVVYKAKQSSLDRTVALKLVLRGSAASPQELARFQAEAEAAAQLDHPAIVPVFEVGQRDSTPFFSMGYIEGQTLADRLAEGPLPMREAVRIVCDVARAIHYAHTRGVIHRDLKPSNVLLDGDGAPHVSDFGLAKRIDAAESLTQTGAVLGTPAYIAPEQAAGSRGTLGPQCDVYSLGTILYSCLTGRPPFQGPSPLDTVLMVLEQDPLPPRLLDERIDRDLEMIVMRCLQKPPELRYATAAALADDLDAYLAGDPIAARSGRFSDIMARLFRESHHVAVLENWGLLWMWHALVLLVLCLVTNGLHAMRATWPIANDHWPYVLMWGGGIAIWAPAFWALRRRAGPVTSVERQIAHAWGGSIAGVMLLFAIEYLLRYPILSLSPVLGVINGIVFTIKAGILAGRFYFHAAALYATSIGMALLQAHGYEFGIALFGVVSALSFFLPGWKYFQLSRSHQ